MGISFWPESVNKDPEAQLAAVAAAFTPTS